MRQQGFLDANFAGEGEGELAASAGATLLFDSIDHDAGWTFVQDELGNQGFVPSDWLQLRMFDDQANSQDEAADRDNHGNLPVADESSAAGDAQRSSVSLRNGFLVEDFAGEGEGELTAAAGTPLRFGEIDHDSGWTLAWDADGKSGYVPSDWLQALSSNEGVSASSQSDAVSGEGEDSASRMGKLRAAGKSAVASQRLHPGRSPPPETVQPVLSSAEHATFNASDDVGIAAQNGFLVEDFAGEGEGELTAAAGTPLRFGEIDHDSGWTLAWDADGKSGYVPSDWLQALSSNEGVSASSQSDAVSGEGEDSASRMGKLRAAGKSAVASQRLHPGRSPPPETVQPVLSSSAQSLQSMPGTVTSIAADKDRTNKQDEVASSSLDKGFSAEQTGSLASPSGTARPLLNKLRAIGRVITMPHHMRAPPVTAKVAAEVKVDAAAGIREADLELAKAAEQAAVAAAAELRQANEAARKAADIQAARLADERAAAAADAAREANAAAAQATMQARKSKEVAASSKALMEAKAAEEEAAARRARNALAADAAAEDVSSALSAISSLASQIRDARFWAPPRPPSRTSGLVDQQKTKSPLRLMIDEAREAIEEEEEEVVELRDRLRATMAALP